MSFTRCVWPDLFCLGLSLVSPGSARTQTERAILRLANKPIHVNGGQLVQQLAIGGDDPRREYQLTRIQQVLLTSSGSIWVIDKSYSSPPRCAVRIYDSLGTFVRDAGHQGMGPGEWQSPITLHELPSGDVVLDDGNILGRVTRYHADGRLDTTWIVPIPIRQFRGISYADHDALLWLRIPVAARGSVPPSGPGGPQAFVRLSAQGRIIDTVRPPARPTVRPSQVEIRSRSGRGSLSQVAPYSAGSWVQWSPLGYFATAATNVYEVRLTPWQPSRDRVARPTIVVRRDVPPVEVTEVERADQRRFFAEQARAYGGSQAPNPPDIPRFKAPISEVMFDLSGRLWVRRAVASERLNNPRSSGVQTSSPGWFEPKVYDVFSPDGEFLGSIRLPDRSGFGSGLVNARGDRLWLVVRDADDVVSIIRYQIQWR